MGQSNGSVTERESDVHHQDIFKNPDEDPSTELVKTVAGLKGVEPNQLDPLYNWADDLISHLYSSPPGPESQAIIEFTYEGYRITLYQDGQSVIMGRSPSKEQ